MQIDQNTKEIIHFSSFELNKLITISKMFSEVHISPSSRLVLKCIIDYWNHNTQKAYPKQSTIAECTGLTRISVVNAVKELKDKQMIRTNKSNSYINYELTAHFQEQLLESCKKNLPDMYKKITEQSKNFLHLLIKNKENKNTNKESHYNGFSSEQTSELLASYKNIKLASPFDNYECALNWLENLTEQSLKLPVISKQAERVRQIWNIYQ